MAHHISPTVLQDGALRVSLQGLVSDRRLELATLQVVSPRLRLALEDSFLRCGFSPTEMRRTAAASTAVAQASHITAEGGPARRPRGGLLLAADDDKGEDSDEDYGDIRDKALDVGQGAIEHSLPARPSPGRRAHADGDSASMLTARVFETRYANREEHRGQRRKAGQQSRSRPQSGLGAALWARTRKGTAPSLSSAAPVREGEGQTYGLRPVLRAAASAPVLPPLRIHSGGGGGDHRSRRRR